MILLFFVVEKHKINKDAEITFESKGFCWKTFMARNNATRILLRETNQDSEEISNSPLKNIDPIPEFCKANKKHVEHNQKCLMRPYYKYSDLAKNNSRITSAKSIVELKRHGHNTTRIMSNEKQRTVADCHKELMAHYLHYHPELKI